MGPHTTFQEPPKLSLYKGRSPARFGGTPEKGRQVTLNTPEAQRVFRDSWSAG
jgi:hypothetical protein